MAPPDDRLVRLLARSGAFSADDPVQERTRRALLFRLAQGGGTVWWAPGMDVAAVLLELYGRVARVAQEAVEGLDAAQLGERPAPGADTIGELIWRLAREQDREFAELAGQDELPTADGAQSLLDHLAAVHDRARSYLAGLSARDLDRVLDDARDPPLTLGVHVVRVVDDGLRHAGAAVCARRMLGTPR